MSYTRPKDIHSAIEIWSLGGADFWLTWSKDEVVKTIIDDLGLTEEEINEELYKVPRAEWAKERVTEVDEKYQPSYTFENMVCMILDRGWDGKPNNFCSTEC